MPSRPSSARALEVHLRDAVDQLRPVSGYRGPMDLTGWGARGLVYGGPGGAAALMAAIVAAAAAHAVRGLVSPPGGRPGEY